VTDLDQVASALLAAADDVTTLTPFSDTDPSFGMDDGYDVLARIAAARRAAGWERVGRKVGFTNVTLWELYGVDAPFVADLWDRTVVDASNGAAAVAIDRFVQPRLEPEIVFGLRGSVPTTGTAADVLAAVEWLAPGFEVVQCHYPRWRFTLADCTASFGLHAALVVGPRTPIDQLGIGVDELADRLATFAATLERDGEVAATGTGANVLGSPLLALQHAARVADSTAGLQPLAAGELVTTGTLTDAMPLEPGSTWRSDYGDLGITGITLTVD